MSGESDVLLVERRSNGVLVATLNRPSKYNAYSAELYGALMTLLASANEDASVKALVLTGSGAYFSSGNDLSNMFRRPAALPESCAPEDIVQHLLRLVEDFLAAWVTFKKVLIVAVNGPAVGVATTTLGLADFVYAVESATFLTPFMSLAQCPEACSSVTFRELMGPTKASEFLLLNKKFTAEEAHEAGLVGAVFKDVPSLMAHALHIADSVAAHPAGALRTGKELMRSPDRTKLLLETNAREMKALAERIKSPEAAKAVADFLSRRSKL